jgi:hypothetical protein
MWIKNCENNRKSSLEIILGNIQKLNKNMIANDILLTASIAYGRFKYVPKPETSSLGKKFLYGDSYLDAYQDNESGSPRIKPGECRVISNEIISEILTNLDHDLYSPLKLLQKKNKTEKRHIYFYWMLNDLSDKDRFNKEYNNAYESRYASIKRLINQELSTNQRI